MALVFAARDTVQGSRVAIKVLRPELSVTVPRERFLREIRVATQLKHPNIVPLLDSGAHGSIIYYVMPLLDGGTLRARLDQVGQLAVAEAIHIAVQVAAALAHAHRHGIVHRDIKPENIVLVEGRAVVTDFGICKAIAATGIHTITDTGVMVGTPAYMSPEQATANAPVGPASDQYSLACVLFEMLLGVPPFSGNTMQVILTRHAVDPLPSVKAVRPTVPRGVEYALRRAAEKVAGDRYANVGTFAAALSRGAKPGPAEVVGSLLRRWRVATAAALAIAAIAVTVAVESSRRQGRVAEGHASVAVLPFDVRGEIDTSLVTPVRVAELLRGGLIGAGGLAAVATEEIARSWEPRIALSSEAALRRLASAVRARFVVVGEVYRTGSTLAIRVSMLDAANREPGLTFEGVNARATPEGLREALDRLATRVLWWTRADLEPYHAMGTESPAAMRALLRGKDHYHRGRYGQAAAAFQDAVDLDSTFVLAAVSWEAAERMGGSFQNQARALSLLAERRATLQPDDRLLVTAILGERYPLPTPYSDQLRLWEKATDSLPARHEAPYRAGEQLLRWGPLLQVDRAHPRARTLLRRALATDSAFAPALELLIDHDWHAGDTTSARALSTLYLTRNSGADLVDYVRWRLAIHRRDDDTLRDLRVRIGQLPDGVLERIVGTAQLSGVGIDDAMAAASALRDRAQTANALYLAEWTRKELLLNTGRLAEASQTIRNAEVTLPIDELFRVVEAVYWDGDTILAATAVGSRAPLAETPLRPNLPANAPQFMDICTVALWRTSQRDLESGVAGVRDLRRARGALDRRESSFLPLCLAILETQLAFEAGAADSLNRLDALENLVREGIVTNPYVVLAAIMTVSRLRERTGDRVGALRVLRSRPFHFSSFGVAGLSQILRDEGRLALEAGEPEAAAAALQHYLALRAGADSQLEPELAEAREQLGRALGAASGVR